MPGYEVLGEEEKKEILEVLETGVLFRYGFPAQRKGRYKVQNLKKSLPNLPAGNMPWRFPPAVRP